MASWSDEQLRNNLTKLHGVLPMFRLRWRFDFSQHKLTRYGRWNGGSQKPEEMACNVNKIGLVRACVEGEKVARWDHRILAEVDGHNFVSFAWEAVAGLPVIGMIGTCTVESQVVGLSIITRDKKISVYIDGRVKTTDLTDYEQTHKLEEHRR